jgi:DNA-binding NarL/FixJ family response regulator
MVTMSVAVRVLVLDDRRLLADALAARLSAEPDLWVLGRYGTDDLRLTELVRQARPDVIIVGAEPPTGGREWLPARLGAAWPPAQIVILTEDPDPVGAVEAARIGAAAWLPADCSLDVLVEAVRGAVRGHAWYPHEQLGALLRALRADVRRARERTGPLDALTARERDVLLSLVEGRRGRELARHLGTSVNTVRTHTSSILRKLDVHSRLEAVALARAHGMVPARESLVVRSGAPMERARVLRPRAEGIRA